MINNKHIFASIYIRSLINQNKEPSYYEKAIITNLSYIEYNFAKAHREVYESILDKAIVVWTKAKEDKEEYLVQNSPLITALYHAAKDELTAAGVPIILFRRVMEKYFAAGDDMYEQRSNLLAKEIFRITQEVEDNDQDNNNTFSDSICCITPGHSGALLQTIKKKKKKQK